MTEARVGPLEGTAGTQAPGGHLSLLSGMLGFIQEACRLASVPSPCDCGSPGSGAFQDALHHMLGLAHGRQVLALKLGICLRTGAGVGLCLEGLHVTHFGFLADVLGIVGQGTQMSLPLSSERPAPDGLVCVSQISPQVHS